VISRDRLLPVRGFLERNKEYEGPELIPRGYNFAVPIHVFSV